MAEQVAQDVDRRRDALVERLFGAVLGMNDLYMVYVGDRLGFYRALVEIGSATPAGLSAAAGTHERYTREWLEQQAVTGILEVEDLGGNADSRRYHLPDGHEEVLTERDSLNYLAPFARMMVGIVRPVPAVLEAFRSGGGVPYADFDADFCEGQSEMNRSQFVNLLGSEWLPTVPDVHARLRADPPARVADVACGTGWSSLALAAAYPKVRVDGFDLDEYSIELAQRNLAGTDLAGRVSFEVRDAADPVSRKGYDLVTVFEAIHDMSSPVEALREMRGLLADGGSVIVADERVAESFTAPGDEVERLMYGWSVLHCLPVGMSDQPSAATGTAMRPETLREYALAAGFRDVEILSIENDFWRFYRLRP
ncbi:MAG: methyltransferase domain-containing protein [Actinomycetota bacterium]|nr:methyltransferase domain-containing protein [Actinomycetota bacterium]